MRARKNYEPFRRRFNPKSVFCASTSGSGFKTTTRLELVSFGGALDALDHFADAVHAAHGESLTDKIELLDAMFQLIDQDQPPLRLGRCGQETKSAAQTRTRS